MGKALDEFNQRERANNATYQAFVKMTNEQLLDWLNTVATTAEHQEHIDIIRNWILQERGYEVVDNPGNDFWKRYRLEPISGKESE